MTIAYPTESLSLLVDVPICAFRPHESREYQDTHPLPPPSAVYGMLLSLCGVPREDKASYLGVTMALAAEVLPDRSRVFRKLRRGAELDSLRPDYQDLLIGLKLWVWLAPGTDAAESPLPQRVAKALARPESVKRSGGLSLGESCYLVNAISLHEPPAEQKLQFLKPDQAGFYNLPIWIDHAQNQNVRCRFNIEPLTVAEGLRQCWIEIHNRG